MCCYFKKVTHGKAYKPLPYQKKMAKLLIASIIILTFLTGFLSNYAIKNIYLAKESPFLISFSNIREQPNDWIKKESIEILKDKVIIHVKDARLSEYESSGSMLPILGENTTGIKIVPNSADEINIGDIVSFEKDNKLIVHRVIEKGKDKNGLFFITKGDNNDEIDGKIYFPEIKYVTIALIY